MRKLFYCGLESYEARYTLQLTEWNRRVFDRRGLDVVYVPGQTLDNSQKIVVGQVLDAHGRSYFSMSQMMNLVRLMQQGATTSEDVVYFEDMLNATTATTNHYMDYSPGSNKFKDVVEAIFSAPDKDTAIAIIDYYDKFWQAIPGTRGATGKKTVNASTMYSKFFVEVDTDNVQLEDGPDFDEESVNKLEELETSVHDIT